MADSKGVGPISQVVEGLRLPGAFSPDAFRSALRYEPRPDDVFIVTYPKCGTTWAQHIMVLVFSHGEPILEPEKFFAASPFLEVSGAESAEFMPRPGAIKVHLPFRLTPRSDQAKYIYITRNPKDCCVSYYHHMLGSPVHGFSGTFDQFFEMFLSGDIDYGDYFDHLMEWYEHKNDPNVLFLTYEEMKEDTAGAVLKMASFIDDQVYAEPLRSDSSKLDNVLHYSGFEHMKQVVNAAMDKMSTMTREDVLASEYPESMKKIMGEMFDRMEAMGPMPKPSPSNFVRKGVVGDWRNYFTEDQSDRLDRKFAERTKGTEIENWWRDCMRYAPN